MKPTDLPPDLQDLVNQLPAEIAPERDLWEDIEAEIAGRPVAKQPVSRPHWGWMLAAAVLIAVGSSALTVALQRPLAAPEVAAVVPPPAAAPKAVLVEWEVEIRQTNAELVAELEARSDEIDPALMEVVRENLEVMDTAIERVREALAADPDNAELANNLAYVYNRKLDLLRQASQYAG